MNTLYCRRPANSRTAAVKSCPANRSLSGRPRNAAAQNTHFPSTMPEIDEGGNTHVIVRYADGSDPIQLDGDFGFWSP